MRSVRVSVTAAICVLALAGVASASWYDDYNDGLAAVRAGNWSVAASKMSAAIAARPKEGNKERAYGTIFINYHPYYYRGVAYLNLGRYAEAVRDLETATGPGPENLGTIDMLLQMAKSRLQQPAPVPPTPEPQPPRPVPVPQPAAPVIDPDLRSRAQSAVNQARARVQAAQQRNATSSPQYGSALQQFTDANTRLATAKSNDDLQAVIATAENAAFLADSAVAPVVVPPQPQPTRPGGATDIVLAEMNRRVRLALESYFRGDFDEAATAFEGLTRDMPTNGWIWAFLGAAKYSQYAFEADETYKNSAVAAFRRAKRLRQWKGGLPDKYFSRRIRRAFNETG